MSPNVLNQYGVGERIRILRQALGQSQDEFAHALEVTSGHISRLEHGIKQPSEGLINKICEKWQVKQTWLEDGEGELEFCRDPVRPFDAEHFGERLRTIRKKYGMTQSVFAEQIGASLQHIKNMETGRNNPSDAMLLQIASRSHCSYGWLRSGTGAMAESQNDIEIQQTKQDMERITMYFRSHAEARKAIISIIDAVDGDGETGAEIWRQMIEDLE